MASKHVPLNQTPEYDTHRENTMMSATAVFNLMSSQRALLGQSVPSIGRKVYLRISEHAVTCISGWAGTSSPMRLRLGNSVWVSVHLPEPTLSWLQTLTLETTLPSSTLACTWQPSAGFKRPILQLRELFYFSQIICQASTWQSWCCR